MDGEAKFTRGLRGNRTNTGNFELRISSHQAGRRMVPLPLTTGKPLHKIAYSRRASKCYYVNLLFSQEIKYSASLLIVTCHRKRVIGGDLVDYCSLLLQLRDQYFARLCCPGQKYALALERFSVLASIFQQDRSHTFGDIFCRYKVSHYAIAL